jgi:uncharacterized repeat protein (TIGR01451 family)
LEALVHTLPRARARALIALLVVLVLGAVFSPSADARIFQLQPADESETPALDFTDDQALFAIGTSDFLGGQICVVSSAITDVGDGSLNCDDAQAWGSPNQIITLGTFITPIESPSLSIGTWRLLGDGGSLPGQDALSLPFTVTPCSVCDPRIGAQSVQYYKDIAARMAPPISDMCTWFNYMNLVGSVATGLRSGATLALNTVGSLPRFGALVGVPIGGSFGFGAVIIAGWDIMADPPDPDYDTVPQPVFSDLPTVNNQLVDDVAESVDRQRAFGAAGLKAFERYQGADNDGDAAGVALQADAMGDRGFELRDEMRKGADLLRQWSVQLAADDRINTRHIDPNDPAISEIAAAEERLRASGFNPAEIADLHSEGFDDAEVADLLRELKRADVRRAPPDKTVMDVVDAAADAMETEADAVDQFARDAYAVAARITAVDRPPHATFTSERDANDPLLVHFDASGSSDPNGDSLTYRWDFHDGTFGEGRTVSHRFNQKGPRIITLWVSDGTTETSFIGQVHAGLQDPVAQFEKRPVSALAPYEAQFDASLSLDPEGKEIVRYEWDFGGGSTAEGKTASHLFTKRGTVNVFLTITTADGRTATTGQQQFVLGMEDLDLPVCGDQGDPVAEPVEFNCDQFAPARGAQVFEVPGSGPRTISIDFVLKLGAFQNELAVFEVDDALGSIGSLQPGDAGYEAAAFERAQTVFPPFVGPGNDDVQLQVNGGDRFVFMLIPGGTLDLVKQNPTNDPHNGAYAFFSLDRLNPDRIPHTVSYAHKTDGSVEFGFEDLLDGGDNDFDDIVYRVSGLEPVPGLVVTKVADDPTSGPGEANGYTVTIANGSGLDVPLASISDSLPAGFVYKPASTSGAVLAEPAVSGGGRELSWNAPGIVPAGGSLSFHFDVKVANGAGEYLNEATAAADGFAVEPSGPTAKVTVEVAPAIPVTPPTDPPVAEVKRAADLVLGCSDRRVVLEDVFVEGRKVRLLGVAAREFAGRKVRLVFGATRKAVAEVTVGADGHFTATAPLPQRKLRNSNKARYFATVGSETSLALKLARRMLVTKVAAAGNRVTIAGKVVRPLATKSKDRTITLQRIVACKKAETVKTFAPAKSGSFSVTVTAPAGQKAAVYRLSTRVRRSTRTKRLTKTFTLPRAVDFG